MTTRSHALRVSQNSLQRGNELTPVIPDFILVIPAKAGIHTDSPPEPYCPVPPWPCHPREGRDRPLVLDSRLRGCRKTLVPTPGPTGPESMGTRVLRQAPGQGS
ncbi:hypothetical protein [Endozoicomonas sp. 8E]|uniref:hypothetical protein n=1 Tax=Endozoicomonas sp. 8E TaxID=3035692 RepID=UPI0029390937|nr:hypothetical protein [Endozoicomonas sp. 8E]WOG29557.1 hypothetical protein P6910_07875 [Endozoicomonas sp. 8E]